MRKRSWVILAAALLVLAVAAFVWLVPKGRGQASPYRTETLQRGDIRVQVSATGTLDAVTTVQVGSQITGTINALYADFNSQVKKGQILALIDPTFLKAQVAQNEADLERARVTQRQAERDLSRQEPLRTQGLASQADIDAAETALDAARASVKSAEAALTRAKTNLAYATITSPIDGIVVSRDVDVGQTVAASLSAPTLFTIAQDLTQMQLEAAVDEADIGMVRGDQSVTFTVDAFPDRTFSGTVQQIRLAPKTEQNVVSYTVVVRVPNPDQRLLPGMTANATFLIDEARGVLRIPAAALRYRPAVAGAGARAGGAQSGGRERISRKDGGSRAGRSEGHDAGRRRARRHGQASGGPGSPGADSPKRGTLYVLKNGTHLQRISVDLGLSDGTYTAASSDSLSEGMQVVVGGSSQTAASPNQGQVNPFAPGGRAAWPLGPVAVVAATLEARLEESAMTSAGPPVLRVADLVKIYGEGDSRVVALAGVSLEIHEGEMVAVMGASGSGKSTLMNILGCLDRPTSGIYELAGQNVSRFTRDQLAEIRNRRIGFVFQNFNLLARTSALENVELPMIYSSLSGREIVTRAREALDRVGLADRAHHTPNKLSGGQQQRVAVARALVNRPSLLLADEPTGNLDTVTSAEVMEIFQELNRAGMTILLITHELDIAHFAKRIIVLRDGRIVEDRQVENRAGGSIAARPPGHAFGDAVGTAASRPGSMRPEVGG